MVQKRITLSDGVPGQFYQLDGYYCDCVYQILGSNETGVLVKIFDSKPCYNHHSKHKARKGKEFSIHDPKDCPVKWADLTNAISRIEKE